MDFRDIDINSLIYIKLKKAYGNVYAFMISLLWYQLETLFPSVKKFARFSISIIHAFSCCVTIQILWKTVCTGVVFTPEGGWECGESEYNLHIFLFPIGISPQLLYRGSCYSCVLQKMGPTAGVHLWIGQAFRKWTRKCGCVDKKLGSELN